MAPGACATQSLLHSNEGLRMMRRRRGEAGVKVDVDESYHKACLKLSFSPFGLNPTFPSFVIIPADWIKPTRTKVAKKTTLDPKST